MTEFRGIGAWRLVNGPGAALGSMGSLGSPPSTWVWVVWGIPYSSSVQVSAIRPLSLTPFARKSGLRKWDSQRVASSCLCWAPGARALNSRQIKHLRQPSQTEDIIGASQCFPRRQGLPQTGPFLNTPQVKHLTVDEDSAGQRLDNFLFRHLKGVPKTHVYRIIRSGEVRINKGRASAESKLSAGDVLRLPPLRMAPAEPEPHTPLAPAREFPVLYEDEGFMAIHKPAGVAVHGGSGVSSGVIEQLRRARPQCVTLELVHRLDRETSGVLLIAKKRSALRHLQDQFRERETGKTYLALVKGDWPERHKVIDRALQKYLLADGERRVRVVPADHPDAMRSITLVKVRAAVPDPCATALASEGKGMSCSLLEVTIKTGRTHQIRVHLSQAGHPIAGDDKYGDFEWNRQLTKAGLSRMFLHAWRLEVHHPVTGERLRIVAQPSAELQKMLPTSVADALNAIGLN